MKDISKLTFGESLVMENHLGSLFKEVSELELYKKSKEKMRINIPTEDIVSLKALENQGKRYKNMSSATLLKLQSLIREELEKRDNEAMNKNQTKLF